MTEKRLEFKGIPIIMNNNLSPTQMKEKGFVNGQGKEIVTELEVNEEIHHKLKEFYIRPTFE